ncbi:MAG: hypothetical protein KGM98_12945, partial [Bacteroidota bacterium]|nr:hypothetical protein [Bacteroidota bacterium]
MTTKAVFQLIILFFLGTSVARAQYPVDITLSGFNADVIAESGLNQTITNVVTISVDSPALGGYVFFENGYSNTGTAFPSGGITNGTVQSTKSGVPFHFAAFTGPNDLRIPVGDSGTLAFSTGAANVKFDSLYVINTGGGGAQRVDYTIYFHDLSTATGNFISNDWGCNCDSVALDSLGRASIIDGSKDLANGNTFSIYQSPAIILGADSTKTIDSIKFVVPPVAGAAGNTNIFAITGYSPTGVVPVTLESFVITQSNGQALLQWKTSQELNNSTYIIKRASENDPANFVQIGEVGAVVSPNGASYSYLDNPGASGTFLYQLSQQDISGNIRILGVKNIRFNALTKWVVQDLGNQWRLICAKPFIYRLLDLQGRVLSTASGSGSALITKPEAAGIYQIQVQTG